MPATLTLSYSLSPPEGTNSPPSLSPSGTHVFAVDGGLKPASGSGDSSDALTGTEGYYAALRKSIAAAKDKIGEELTAWRDAVGSAEAGKEMAAKAARAEDEEEGEEEEEE